MKDLFGGVVDTAGLEKLEGQPLLDELKDRFFSHHVVLDYSAARKRMFGEIDNQGGKVVDVYAMRTFPGGGIPKAEGANGFNTEHTWPQSKLKEAGKHDAISDLNHLFPVETFANGKRGHVPFGWVKKVEWENGHSKLGLDDKGQRVFTPPEIHRGNVARAMFWIATAYELDIPADEEAVLKQWAKEDPVDPHERARTEAVAKVQGDANPFVLHPELVDKVKDF
jgi:endonuclease I